LETLGSTTQASPMPSNRPEARASACSARSSA